MKESDADNPPYSRAFVLHSREMTEKQLYEVFSPYGTIESVWMVKDKSTGEPKGVSYIKYTKMSEAAAACDGLNAVSVCGFPRPMKVIIANSRNESPGSRRTDDMERFLRLFIVIAKDGTDTEPSLISYFSQYGLVDRLSILKDKATGECKGFAYVKFKRVTDAANALEKCDQRFKAVLAKPKTQQFAGQNDSYDKAMKEYNYSIGASSFRVSFRTQKILLEYDTPSAASRAWDKLDGFEYPLGEPIMVKPEYPGAHRFGDCADVQPGGRKRKRDYGLSTSGSSYMKSEPAPNNRIENLTEALKAATSIINAAGLTTGSASQYCSADLPAVQPMVKGEEGKHRLFIVCLPEAPPLQALKDIFCRFGNLVDVYVLPGKNFGYASYCDKSSAEMAISVMNGQELFGSRLKVLEAEPPREEKKIRTE